jgi:hypothetical protein
MGFVGSAWAIMCWLLEWIRRKDARAMFMDYNSRSRGGAAVINGTCIQWLAVIDAA